MKTSAQFKLGGISKIAIVKFNSLQDDASVGIHSADEDTIQFIQSLVSSTFSSGKTYKVTNLDHEIAIADAAGDTGRTQLLSTMSQRFDAIIYGRIWWQLSPEFQGRYPYKFDNLEEWENISYTSKDLLGKDINRIARVITSTEDVVQLLPFRCQKASLMLSLSIYRVDASGMLEKVVETYAVASDSVCFANGQIQFSPLLIGVHDMSKIADIQKANDKGKSMLNTLFSDPFNTKNTKTAEEVKLLPKTIPAPLYVKYDLANKIVSVLAPKLQPTNVTFELPNDFSDNKLTYLLNNNAFLAGSGYSNSAFVNSLHANYDSEEVKAILKEKDDILDDMNIPDAYSKSTKLFKKAVSKNLVYIYSFAICEEGLGHYQNALSNYRLAFSAKPNYATALGISRCLFAMDMAGRIKETKKDVRKATKKSILH